jgi:acetyl esterase
LETHDNLCRILANSSGHAVLSIDYRLAPEHPYPAALEDAITATRWAHLNAESLGCSPDRIAIGGDSAGGTIAIVVGHLAPAPLGTSSSSTRPPISPAAFPASSRTRPDPS